VQHALAVLVGRQRVDLQVVQAEVVDERDHLRSDKVHNAMKARFSTVRLVSSTP
jgi:hypothetical protein